MNYQIGNQKFTEDKLKNMSGTDANALYYATHQGNKQANTMFSNPGSYVDTGSQSKVTKEEYDQLVKQIEQIQKNLNEPKREVPQLQKPQYDTTNKLAMKQYVAEQTEQKNQNKELDYYSRKELEEERSNLWNKGIDMTDLESNRLKDIDNLIEHDDQVKKLKAQNLDTTTKEKLNKEAQQYFNKSDSKKANLLSNRKNEQAFTRDMQAKYGYSPEQIKTFLNQYKSSSNPNNQEWLVSREKYDELMQNQQMQKDIDALAQAYANEQGTRGRGIRAIQNMGYRNTKDYVNQLSERYNLSEDELNDIVKTYMSDREQVQSQKMYDKLYNLGQKYEVAGTVIPMVTKGMSGVEGYYNVLANEITGDERNQSHLMNALSTGGQAGVSDEINNEFLKGAYNMGVGAGGAVFNALGGGMGIFAQSGNAANEAMNSAIERGIDPRQAAAYGMVAGLTDYLFNRKGFEKIEKRLVNQAKGTVGQVLKQTGKNAIANFGIEGGENVAQDIVQSIADQIINGKNGELTTAYADNLANGQSEEDAFFNVVKDYAAQLGMSGLQGGIAGSLFGASKDIGGNVLGKAAGKYLELKANRQSKGTQNLKQDALARRNELLGQQAIPEVNSVAQPNQTADLSAVEAPSIVNDTNIPEVPQTTVEQPKIDVNEPNTKQRSYDNYNRLRNTIDNNRLAKNIKFDDNADAVEFDKARKDLYAKVKAYSDAVSMGDDASMSRTMSDVDTAYKRLSELAQKGYVDDKTNQAELRKLKKDFANKTKGVVINLPDDMRSEMGIKDETINGLNRRLSTLGGNDHIKFSKSKGTPIDQIWGELVDASGRQLNADALNNADMVAQLIEYVDGLKVDGKGVQRVPADIRAYVPDALFDTMADMYNEATMPTEVPQTIAENVGTQNPTLTEPIPQNNIPVQNIPQNMPNVPEATNQEIPGNRELSRFATNTSDKAGIINVDMLNNDPELEDAALKERHSNAKTLAAALDDVKRNGEQWYNDVVNGDYILGQPKTLENGKIDYEKADQDFDEGMIILRNLQEQADQAPDDATRQAILAKKNALFRKMRQFSSNAGRILQAHQKWTNTAEGAIMAGDKMLGEATNVWTSRNKGAVKTNRRLAEALKQQGYDGSMDNIKTEPPTFDQLREQVRNTLDREFASVEDQFTDSDIDYLAGLLSQNATVDELVDALNTKMATGRFGLSDATQAEVTDLFKAMEMYNPESQEYADLQLEAFRQIANETKSKASALEKFDAWRYLAMLGNPKTMIRNWVGNQIFNVVTGVSNNVAALGEMGVDAISKATGHEGIQRTKALINPFDRKAISGAQTDFNKMRYQSGAGSKYKDTKSAIKDATSVFDSQFAQLWEKLTEAGISDTSAVRRKYATSLLGYMKANGLTDADMDASYRYDELYRQQRLKPLTDAEVAEMESLKPTADAMEKARDYALKQADYATFHEDNAVAQWLTKVSQDSKENGKGIANVLIEGLVPFKKTPANVLRSGVEYSPFGAIASIAKTGKLIYENTGKRKENFGDTYTSKNGKKDIQRTLASDVIDSWSKTLTGSGLTMLGYYLFNKGILKSSSDDEKYQDQLEGLQNYSIEINGHTYSIDWAAPAVMPLLLGAELSKVFNDSAIPAEEGYSKAGQIVDTINALLEPVMETSMLQGINDTLTTAANQVNNRNGETNAIAGILGAGVSNMATSYFTQAIPTILGQFARTADNTRRTTDTVNTGLPGVLEKQGRKIMNKVPLLSMLNTPYRDARGETQSNNPLKYEKGDVLGNIGKGAVNLAYQMASPGYLDKIDTRESDRIARDTYNALDANGNPIKDADVFADWKSQVKINGQRLTPEQMDKYREAGYSERTKIREELAKSGWFDKLSGEERTEILKSTNTLADQIGKKAADPDYTSKSEVYDVYQKGGINGVLDYYQDKAHKNEVKDALGTSADWAIQLFDNGNQKDLADYNAAKTLVDNAGLDMSEKDYLIYKKYGAIQLNRELETKKKLKGMGVNDSKFVRELMDNYVSSDTIQKANKDITSVVSGKDEFDRDQHLTMNETTYDIWKKQGISGLKEYAQIDAAGANWKTYEQAKKFYPSMTVEKYTSTFKSLDGSAGSKANGDISQKELLQYYNTHDMTDAERNQMWKAYGDPTWKGVPVLKYNKKTRQYEWQAVTPKSK